MSIVKRKDSLGRTYYYNTVAKKRSTEEAFNRSKGAAKKAKTQFKTAKGYACSRAGRDLKTTFSSSAGRRLRKCQD
jgi:hypothetical protein